MPPPPPVSLRVRERGVALVLAFLVLLILVAVAGEITVTSAVDRGIALHELEDMRCEFAARGAVEVAKALLMRDARERPPPGSDLRPATTESLALFAGLSRGGAPGRSEPTPEPAAWTVGAHDPNEHRVDSFLDAWADPVACQRTFAGDLRATIRVVDEDGKINLLWLAADDARLRDLWKDRITRLLDGFREGTIHDVIRSDAERITNGISDWIRGRRSGKMPRPCLSTMTRRESLAVFGKDRFQEAATDGPVLFPLGLDELLNVPGVTPDLLDGFLERETYIPGLRDVTTVFTSLLFDPGNATRRAGFVWGFMKQQREWQRRDKIRQEARQRALSTQILESGAGRINANTAPVAVLQAICRSAGLSSYVVSSLDGLRPARGIAVESMEPFRASQGILTRLEAEHGPIRTMPQADRADLENAFGHQSHVFTVLVRIRGAPAQMPAGTGIAKPNTRLRYRTVLWRRIDREEETQLITLVPLHRWNHPVEGEEEGNTP